MTLSRKRMLIGILLLVGVVLGAVGYAQVTATQPVTPRILSGADVGFRVEGMRGDTPVGTLMVRVNDRWVVADFSAGTRRLGTN